MDASEFFCFFFLWFTFLGRGLSHQLRSFYCYFSFAGLNGQFCRQRDYEIIVIDYI